MRPPGRRPSRLVLLGQPVAHSLSPAFQTAALQDAGFDVTYEALDVAPATLAETFRTLKASNAAGNVTIPHKAAAFALCDVVSETARAVGAVNTFWCEDGLLYGDNTDVAGFTAAVRALLGEMLPGLRVTLLGAGGSAAAVATAVGAWSGATLTVWNRTRARAVGLAQRFDHTRVNLDLTHAVRDADLVVNSTPIGLLDDTLPIDITTLSPYAAVLDLVYKRGETALVRAARATGHPAADGRHMLVEQGALAFERWFGIVPNREVMWRAASR